MQISSTTLEFNQYSVQGKYSIVVQIRYCGKWDMKLTYSTTEGDSFGERCGNTVVAPAGNSALLDK